MFNPYQIGWFIDFAELDHIPDHQRLTMVPDWFLISHVEIQKDRKTKRQKDKKTKRQKDRKKNKQIDKKTKRQKERRQKDRIDHNWFLISPIIFKRF